jgi:hypothetical protein
MFDLRANSMSVVYWIKNILVGFSTVVEFSNPGLSIFSTTVFLPPEIIPMKRISNKTKSHIK